MWKARVVELPASLLASRRNAPRKPLPGTAKLPNVDQG
jgi:hypothetical protein